MANTSLRREVSVTGNRKIFTFSAWVKKTKIADNQNIFSQYVGSGSANIATHFRIRFQTTDALAVATGGTDMLLTNAVYRDTNAWYHVVCAVDTTQSTADDRIKLYVNGEQITSFASRNNPSQDVDTVVNLAGSSHYPRIGADDSDGAGPYNFFDGLMSHVHFIDGTAYPASTFGSTDSVTGQWQLNTDPSITMGTNGFTILKDGNTITDQSANSNDFISLGAGVTNTEDNPSNIYCTFNPLIPQGLAYANGNLSVTHNASSWKTAYGTIAMSGTGKYYFESKVSALGSYQGIGIVDAEQISASASKFGAVSRGYGYKNDGSKTNNNSDASYGATYTTGDIIGCALDLTNGAIYFSKNGAWQNSATTGEIAAGTTTNAAYTSISSSYVYLPAVQIYGSGTNQFNVGNGFFGTTAVSSVQNPSSGDTSAKFEYTPPTGFQPITTKGLNE